MKKFSLILILVAIFSCVFTIQAEDCPETPDGGDQSQQVPPCDDCPSIEPDCPPHHLHVIPR